jgi:EpsI family protein
MTTDDRPVGRQAEGRTRRDLLLGGLFLATSGAAFAARPRQSVIAIAKGDFTAAIPERIGAWSMVHDVGFVMPPEDERKAAAVYQQQLTRSYADGVSPAIMMVIAYDRSQSGMLMVHRPESCYPGAGFDILSDADTPIALAPHLTVGGRFLSTVRDVRHEQVLYWTRFGNAFPQDWDAQRWEIAAQNLRGLIPDGALVRLSVVTPDVAEAQKMLRQFATEMFAGCGSAGRALLAGPINA